MRRKVVRKNRNRKYLGIAPLVEPGYGALYIRTAWMPKLTNMGKGKSKVPKRIAHEASARR
jgi:hypothetical protein